MSADDTRLVDMLLEALEPSDRRLRSLTIEFADPEQDAETPEVEDLPVTVDESAPDADADDAEVQTRYETADDEESADDESDGVDDRPGWVPNRANVNRVLKDKGDHGAYLQDDMTISVVKPNGDVNGASPERWYPIVEHLFKNASPAKPIPARAIGEEIDTGWAVSPITSTLYRAGLVARRKYRYEDRRLTYCYWVSELGADVLREAHARGIGGDDDAE